MTVTKIECLVDAIGRLNGLNDPESECYRLRNPLMIRSFASPGKHHIDEHGRRAFGSLVNGYKACLFDIELKLKGASRSGVKSNNTLQNLLAVYGITEPGGVSNVVSFLRRALQDPSLSKETPLTYFLPEKKINITKTPSRTV